MPTTIEVRGLDSLIARMSQYPQKLLAAMRTTVEASLYTLWENVPPYPPPPTDSTYRRTGTLGRMLGSSMTGGRSGEKPEIFELRELGSSAEGALVEGHFGTRLEYAPYVIGDNEQAWMHAGRWWTISKVGERAKGKIIRLFQQLANKMAAFLDGKEV